MSKARLHHIRKRFHLIPMWALIVALAFSTILTVWALRNNNLQMVKLRQAVYVADENNGDVEAALQKLRAYVYSHMNTDLTTGNSIRPPIQLKNRYESLVAAAKTQVEAVNSQVYTQAQAVCEQLVPLGAGASGRNRIACIEDYVTKHGAKEQPIPEELYKFDFVSPVWSPDLAGFSVLVTAALLVAIILRFISDRWLKKALE